MNVTFKMIIRSSIAIFLLLSLLFACKEKDKAGRRLTTPTGGSIRVAIDASLMPLLDAEIDAFEGAYKNADIEEIYTSEAAAVEALIKDSVSLITIARELSQDELSVFTGRKITVKQLVVAEEGIALILNRDNPDTLLRIEQLKQILTGEIKRWDQLHKTSHVGDISLIFNQPNSAIVRFLHDSVTQFKELPSNCYAVNGDPAVVDYVMNHKNGIGLIGACWISDQDDPMSNIFLKKIRIAGIAKDASFYQPYQAYIIQGLYPLTRKIVMISSEARAGLATGFMAYVAGDRGQRIILKAGLVPATMPVRVVEINHEPF